MNMKKPLVIVSSLSLFLSLVLSPFVYSQPEPSAIIQPLMDCLNQSIPAEKARSIPSKRGIKNRCSKELQALSALQPDIKASIMSQIDKSLDKHMADMPNAAVDIPKVE